MMSSVFAYFQQFSNLNISGTSADIAFKADRLQMIVVAKKYICVATVHQ